MVISSSSPLAGPAAIVDATSGGLEGASSTSPAASAGGAGVGSEDSAGMAEAGEPKLKAGGVDELANADGCGAVEAKEKLLAAGLVPSAGVPNEKLLAAGAPKLKAGLLALSAEAEVAFLPSPTSEELFFWPKLKLETGVVVGGFFFIICFGCSPLASLALSDASIWPNEKPVDAVRGLGDEPNPPPLDAPAPRLKLPGEKSAGFDGVVAAAVEGDPKRLPPGLTVGVIAKIADLRFAAEPSVGSSRGRLGVDVETSLAESWLGSAGFAARISRTNSPAELAGREGLDVAGTGIFVLTTTGTDPKEGGFGAVSGSFCGGATSVVPISTSSAGIIELGLLVDIVPLGTGSLCCTSFPFLRLTTFRPALDCIFAR